MANTNDDVIIVGSLSDNEMRKAIDDLVSYVGDQTTLMAGKFTKSIDLMRDAMKDFAVTQKVSVDLMKQAWREMSSSFDAMVAAQSQSTGGSGGSGGSNATPDSVKALKEDIAAAEQMRDTLQQWSPQLYAANEQIEKMRNNLNSMLAKGTLKEKMADARKELGDATSMPTKNLGDAQRKLATLEALQQKYKNTTLLSVQQTNRLATAIQTCKDKIDKLTQTKPQKLSDVLGMDENSFDSITKKMSALKKLTWSDDNEKNTIIANYQRLREEQNKLLSSNAKMARSNNYLAQSFGYIRNRIVYALTLGAITSFTKQIYEIRGQYELLERSLGVLLNSFEKGSQVFQELNQMAIESPFTLMELAGAAKQLTAYNFAANEVVDTTRRLADISAALGVPMERLTYNLGQIRAQTVLNARDARDFANAGLPIVKSLSEYYTELEGKVVSTGEVYDRMSKKMVSYTDVMAVLNKMTDEGGKFFEFQAKQAETLRVQMANLTLAWNNMLNEMGEGNQSLLSLPIKGLKVMLQNWSSLNRVLKNVILSIGLLKVAQMIAIRQQLAWAASTGTTAKMMGFLANSIKGVIAATKALFLNPWTWVFVGILAVTDLIGQWRAARKELAELNQEIKEGAGEASQSNLDFLNNKGNKATREAAKEGKLSAEQAAKAWESVEQQLLNSASSANSLLGELWAIDDVNQRVAKGFDYAERIQKAQAALQDLKDDTIKVSQDAGWWGMFGEGLQSDLKDFYTQLMAYKPKFQAAAEDFEEIYKSLTTQQGSRKDSDSAPDQRKEFLDELEVTAESINNFIKAYDIKDPLQINEILSRVKAQIKTRNPEIKGEMATLFDVSLDQRMSELTNGAVDKNASLWAMFMERLKHNSSATFQGITDEIYKESGKLSEEQQAAVDANLAYFKDSMPWYYNAVKSMVEDASQLKIHIGIAFNVQALTDFQKQVRDRISNASSALDFGSDAMLPTQNDNLQSWVKTQQGAIKSLQEQNKLYRKDSSQWAKDQIAANDREIQQRKNLLDLFNQSYAAEKKGGRGRKDVDIVAEALKQEIQLINDMRSNYDKLRKAGVSDTEAMTLASKGYEMTILRINSILQKFGIDKFNAGNFAGKNVRELLDNLTKQRDALLASGKVKTSSLKDLDVMIQKLTVDAKTFDMKKITDGLNSELGKLKDEYELAIELDANPELGGIFADMMGIDESQLQELPRTFNELVVKLQQSINKLFADNNVSESFNLMEMLNTADFEAWVKQNGHTLEDDFIKQLNKIREYANKVRLDETKATTKNWSDLVEKYGNLQSRLLKIAKDSVKQQLAIAKKFGNAEQQKKAQDLANQITFSQDPAEVARLQRELVDLLKTVTQGDDQAVSINTAVQNQQRQHESKAYWDDFKDSELYTMMFEDMSRNSTRAIQLIIDKLTELQGKVKEDPASMKALSSALKDARKELESRSSTITIVTALKEMKAASEDVTKAKKALAEADREVNDAEAEFNASTEGTKAYANAVERLRKARERQEQATLDAANAENKYKASQKKLQAGMETLSEELSNIQGLFGAVAKLFAAAGDDETAEAINAISEGFSIMTTIIMGVVAAMVILESTVPWLLAIAAALSVIVGLVSWLSGSNDKDISKEVKKSELAVKRLENSYKNLEKAMESAYGAMQIAARKAMIANKELQLAELQRQLQLEKSRDSKKRDAGKIADLEGQIIDMKNEIQEMRNDITNSFLGISSVADAVKSMVDDIVDALRNGEDAMSGFNDSIDDMIANMIKQVFSARILGPMLEKIWQNIDDEIQQRGEGWADWLVESQTALDHIMTNTNDTGNGYYFFRNAQGGWAYDNNTWRALMTDAYKDYERITYEEWKAMMQDYINRAQAGLEDATTPTMNDIRRYAGDLRSVSPELEAYMSQLEDILREMGLIKDTTSEQALSKLQQGIQGITEDTAGAIEAYMNSVNQQVYLQSDLLAQIRDTILGFELDIQVATLGQMLLQLQQSYQVQQSIENILQNVLNPSGRAFSVELIS